MANLANFDGLKQTRVGNATIVLHITLLSYDIPFTGKHEPNKLTYSQLCDFVAQSVRALRWHRRGYGSNPVESPEFFRFMRQLLEFSRVISSFDFKHRTSYNTSFIIVSVIYFITNQEL